MTRTIVNYCLQFCIATLLFATDSLAQAACVDRLDNDGDGKIDAYTEVLQGNQQSWSITGDPESLVRQVNDVLRLTGVPQNLLFTTDGAFRNTDATATEVCRLLGYQRHTFRDCRHNDGRCNYTSPGNNFHHVFNGVSWSRIVANNANPAPVQWLSSLSCAERVADCRNGYDDDKDGLIDLADSGCLNANDASEFIHDDGCSSPVDTTETAETQCSDGVDNDGDGARDALTTLLLGNNQSEFFGGNPDTVKSWVNVEAARRGIYIGTNDTMYLSQANADIICKWRGFERGINLSCVHPDGRCGFTSPGDNVHWQWNGTGFTAQPARNDNRWLSSMTCTGRLSACRDGIDNDGDGRADLADTGCASADDNSEIPHDPACTGVNDPSEFEQCRDGADNDSDGLIDLADPGCSNANDDNEGDGTSQCQDRFDNDGDGAIDFPADFSCASSSDNDETNPRAQCQDGLDNDGDALTDNVDPGCSSNQDNNEGDGTTQCQDGIDNDGDSATDFPADFSCSSKADNDEANPKAACQDGIDNDNDGVTDNQDPGCANNQDNNEGDGTTQCQDGLDNDGDGATDFPADYSCSARTDNDETNPRAQCQDGIDNDADGLTDTLDQGCSSNQDNNEGDRTSQCQDNLDNDGDGARDFPADFSCSSKIDNDESNPKAACQDGADNDRDGLTDTLDPGCSSSQDNNEADGTTQCQDGVDNDLDGAQDFPADFSCSSATDNDEANPRSQCQDSLDNDNDGLADSADPGCANNQDNNEGDKTTQCQDGIDNDSDAAIDFPLDYSCASKTDNDEANPRSQCQDGLDNDNDGLTDIADPGCANNQDNNEGDRTTQCQDGIDNDTDNAIDFPADFGCSAKTDNDEANPKAACQDGVDNDSDSLTDLADPGCSNNQDNNEGDGTSQCQDGIDNDQDTAIDAADPGCSTQQDNNEGDNTTQCQDGIDNDGDGARDLADFSCSSTTDNDETNPKSQCQDGTDNDSDGLIDLTDPGCSNAQDNNEGDKTTQCQDGIDNDNDSALDFPADFSCSSRTDNDEANPKAGCQDGLDNDNDGLTDLADPGCANNQDNNESDGTAQCQDSIDNDSDGAIDFPNDYSCSSKSDNDEAGPKSQCQDGIDNDGDGLIDLNDPSCSDNQDNNESDGSKNIIPVAECVTENSDGTYTAYFGYDNLNATSMIIDPAASGTKGVNFFTSALIDRGQTRVFRVGRVRGSFSVIFDGAPISWTIQPIQATSVSATASRDSNRCIPVTPKAECVEFAQGGGMQATFSYTNSNAFNISIPVGSLNQFAPAPIDRAQPTTFLPGQVTAAFKAFFPASSSVTWIINGRSALASSALPFCPGSEGCTLTPSVDTKSKLDALAITLTQVTKTVSKRLVELAKKDPQVIRDAARAGRAADQFLVEANALTFKVPDVIRSCPNAPQFCAQVDNKPTIDGLGSLYRRQWSQIKRIVARNQFRVATGTRDRDALFLKTRTAYRAGLITLESIPRFATECE